MRKAFVCCCLCSVWLVQAMSRPSSSRRTACFTQSYSEDFLPGQVPIVRNPRSVPTSPKRQSPLSFSQEQDDVFLSYIEKLQAHIVQLQQEISLLKRQEVSVEEMKKNLECHCEHCNYSWQNFVNLHTVNGIPLDHTAKHADLEGKLRGLNESFLACRGAIEELNSLAKENVRTYEERLNDSFSVLENLFVARLASFEREHKSDIAHLEHEIESINQERRGWRKFFCCFPSKRQTQGSLCLSAFSDSRPESMSE